MQQKEITIGGKQYPIVFTLKTMMNYEEITGQSFFSASFDNFKERIALIISAIFAADEKTDITVEQLANADTWQAAQDIVKAYVAVMELSAKFFNIPEVEPKDEPAPAEDEEQPKKLTTAHELYQMFVGEIGFSRHEFLHELVWWEVKSIIRGYNARHHAGWEQARLVAYNAHYCMGSKETPPTVNEWIKFPWERKPTNDDGTPTMPTDKEIEHLRQLMREENEKAGF